MGKSPGLLLYLWITATMCVASLQKETELSSNRKLLSSNEEQAERVRDAGHMQRKLLVEHDVLYTTSEANQNSSSFRVSGSEASRNWSILMGVVMATLSVAFLIILAVKCHVFQRFLGGQGESLLPEEETASQFSHPGTLSSSFPQYRMRGREEYAGDREEDDDDDDGFIEDNYITASVKEKTEMEGGNGEVLVDDSDDELDIHFSIE